MDQKYFTCWLYDESDVPIPIAKLKATNDGRGNTDHMQVPSVTGDILVRENRPKLGEFNSE